MYAAVHIQASVANTDSSTTLAFLRAGVFAMEAPPVAAGVCVPQWVVEGQGSRSRALQARIDPKELRVSAGEVVQGRSPGNMLVTHEERIDPRELRVSARKHGAWGARYTGNLSTKCAWFHIVGPFPEPSPVPVGRQGWSRRSGTRGFPPLPLYGSGNKTIAMGAWLLLHASWTTCGCVYLYALVAHTWVGLHPPCMRRRLVLLTKQTWPYMVVHQL